MTGLTFLGKDLIVRSAGSPDSADVIVTFSPWNVSASRGPLDDNAEGFAEHVFEREQKQVVYVIARRNHWYQTPESGEAMERVKTFINRRNSICYGGSMGGSAAFHFAPRLNAKYVAIAPQYSIDREQAPFEKRWVNEAGEINFRPDLLAQNNRQTGLVIFDPATKLDRAQAKLIERSSAATLLVTPFGGHGTTRHVQNTYGLRRIVLEVLSGSFDPARFRAEVRSRRRADATYAVHLITHLLRRGSSDAAETLLRRTLQEGHVSFQELHKLIRAFRLAGQIEVAERLFARLEAEPRTKPSDHVVFGKVEALMRSPLPLRPIGPRAKTV